MPSNGVSRRCPSLRFHRTHCPAVRSPLVYGYTAVDKDAEERQRLAKEREAREREQRLRDFATERQKLANLEREAREKEQRLRDLEAQEAQARRDREARFQEEQAERARRATQPPQGAVTDANAILVGVIALLLTVISVLLKGDLPKSVKIGIAILVPTVVSVVLYMLGVKTDFTILSIPIAMGFVVALIYSTTSA